MIKIIGIGGGGCNILSDLMKRDFAKAEFIAVNSDHKSLDEHEANNKIKLSYYGEQNINVFMSLNGYPKEEVKNFRKKLTDSDVVIIIVCLGGQTGSRLIPVFTDLANEMSVKCHLVVTLPFNMEGERRHIMAENSLRIIEQKTFQSIQIFPNQYALNISSNNGSLLDVLESMSERVANHAIKLCGKNNN